MKIIVFTTILISLRFITLGQENYLQYHKNIALIEHAILEKKYNEAILSYNILFNSFKHPFVKDIYNAAICAILNNQDSLSMIYLKRLAERGIEEKYIKNKNFKTLKKNKNYKIFISEYDSIQKNAVKFIDNKYIKSIDSMLIQDQLYRNKRNAYSNFNDKIKEIDSLNCKKLYEILKQDSLGKRYYIVKTPFGLRNYEPEYIIIRHAYQSKNFILSDILYNCLIKGTINPYNYAELEDKKSNYEKATGKYGIVVFCKIQNQEREIYYSPEKIDEFNSNRKSIGLESFEDYKEKILLHEKNETPFIFMIYEGYVIFRGLSLSDFDKVNHK